MKKRTTKEALLQRLKRVKGAWVSGQAFSRELSISRAAVSKNIQTLRREGYRIQAVTNKGYRLTASPDRLFETEIRQGLNTRIFGRRDIFHYDKIDSTNNRAKELADGGAAEGTLVIAETQTAGRGRRGRFWVSPQNDGIYLSMVARPQISPAEAPQITLLTAVALAEAIMDKTDLSLQIKWPNDLLIRQCKLAGILTELRTEMDLVNYVVIGIGLNVNTSAEALDSVTDRAVTSIAMETGCAISRLKLLQAFLNEFERQYEWLGTQRFGMVLDRWKTLAEIVGQSVTVDVAGQTRRGVVVDVEETGALVIENNTGGIQRIFSGDLRASKKMNYCLDTKHALIRF